MKSRFQLTAIALMLLILPSLLAAPAGIRPGPPPDPFGIRPAAASPADRPAEARKPGPPPDPLKAEHRA